MPLLLPSLHSMAKHNNHLIRKNMYLISVRGCELPSLSPLTTAVVSVESQLSCSVTSVGPTGATAESAAEVLLPEAGRALLPARSVGDSDSEVVFVHWRAFFYKV